MPRKTLKVGSLLKYYSYREKRNYLGIVKKMRRKYDLQIIIDVLWLNDPANRMNDFEIAFNPRVLVVLE